VLLLVLVFRCSISRLVIFCIPFVCPVIVATQTVLGSYELCTPLNLFIGGLSHWDPYQKLISLCLMMHCIHILIFLVFILG
jgi:hypothetical protein